MKKNGIVVIALVCGLILFAAFSQPASPIPSTPPKNIPDSVWVVMENSCYGCHSDDGNGMAKAKLNFDRWDEYAPDKQMAKTLDICNELKKGKMPPSKFSKNNPDAVPTDIETARVCNWVQQIEK